MSSLGSHQMKTKSGGGGAAEGGTGYNLESPRSKLSSKSNQKSDDLSDV